MAGHLLMLRGDPADGWVLIAKIRVNSWCHSMGRRFD